MYYLSDLGHEQSVVDQANGSVRWNGKRMPKQGLEADAHFLPLGSQPENSRLLLAIATW